MDSTSQTLASLKKHREARRQDSQEQAACCRHGLHGLLQDIEGNIVGLWQSARRIENQSSSRPDPFFEVALSLRGALRVEDPTQLLLYGSIPSRTLNEST